MYNEVNVLSHHMFNLKSEDEKVIQENSKSAVISKRICSLLILLILLVCMNTLSGCASDNTSGDEPGTKQETVTEYSYQEYPLMRNNIDLHLDCVSDEKTQPEKSILLVHGATYSSHEFDIDFEDYSLVKRLADEGNVEALCSNFIDKVFSEETIRKYKKSLMRLNSNATEQDMKRFCVLARACLEFEAYEGLKNLKCPTLVLGAELDRTLGVIASREIAEALERNGVPVELYVYDNYGHAAYDEAPDYLTRIKDFLGTV